MTLHHAPTPEVSVLIPVRNGEPYLEETLSSLAAQTFRSFEVVIVDNGSTDGTAALLERWTARDERFRAVRVEQAQLARSLNLAAALARSDLFARLDADDLALPFRLEQQVAAMRSHPWIGVLGTDVELIDERGRRVGASIGSGAWLGSGIREASSSGLIASSTIMRSNLFYRAGGYRAGLNISEDFDLLCRMAEHCQLARLATVAARYRVRRGSITARQPTRMAIAAMCIYAANEARQRAVAEPFVRGCPHLRAALPLLNLDRPAARRKIALRRFTNRLTRRLLTVPLPLRAKMWAAHAVRRLPIRNIYRSWLGHSSGAGRGEPPAEVPAIAKECWRAATP